MTAPTATAARLPQRPIHTGHRTVQDSGLLGAFLGLMVALTLASDAFLTKANLLNLLEANADVGIAACAGTFVVVAGGLDLSVGAIFALAGIVSAKVAISTGVPAGILCGVLSGVALGALNGLIVTVGRVNSFIATLATGIMFVGVGLVISGGLRVVPGTEAFTEAGRGALGGVKYTIWLFVLTAIVTTFVLSRTRFGRQVFAVGASPATARLSGVPVDPVRWSTFALSGLAAGIAGVLIASRSGQVSAEGGGSFALSVIAAIAIGGNSFRGGEGAIWRTVIGVLLLGLVNNGLNLLNVDARYDQLVLGLLILAAVGTDLLVRRVAAGRALRNE